MSDFGGKLRLARERRGISLRQIAASTKISAASLEALERNDISKLPGGIFSRAFVRSYAVEVGLDPDETVKEFLTRFQGETPQASAAPPPIPESESNFDSQQRIASVVLKLVLISIPIVAAILYFTLRARPAEPAPAPAPAPVAVEQPAAAPADPPPVDAAAAAPVAKAPAPAPPPATSKAEAMTLELQPTAECWIKLTVDGRPVLARLMQPGEKDVRKVRETAIIEVGNAGALAFTIDGRPGKPLGSLGQKKTATITRETVSEYLQ
jgi:cytoskeleton protein RodZ